MVKDRHAILHILKICQTTALSNNINEQFSKNFLQQTSLFISTTSHEMSNSKEGFPDSCLKIPVMYLIVVRN